LWPIWLSIAESSLKIIFPREFGQILPPPKISSILFEAFLFGGGFPLVTPATEKRLVFRISTKQELSVT
jgi:hypothetical protein